METDTKVKVFMQKNVKIFMFASSICCFMSKIHLMQSFFMKNIWCVRKQLVPLHRLKKVEAFDNGKKDYIQITGNIKQKVPILYW